MADAADLKSAAARREGSSPSAPTRFENRKKTTEPLERAFLRGLEPMRWNSVKKTCQWHVFRNSPDRACEGGVGARVANAGVPSRAS